ncbi:inositol 2-dehydrogenase [Alkalihalobacillus sp. MEB130]|uniref:inositol 2-dehydrogenase n=1 Tax=Alkalihalobacillus sp. MEB130 TaxID=2976704 RepID=UPI0028DECBB4|nr:inositol 2-dehydrogenase [Alkalihalobacillus sp. MEB130]MDT8860130.1 inositol 2-dehydrogenase [Alkalihalobacillus sp. MEB130]
MKKINVGIIGAGRIGKLHAENISAFPNVSVKTVSDLYADRLISWAEQFGISQITTDYQDILDDPEIDAVLVCAPTSLHSEIIFNAIEAKKHIFCEKPITFDLEESEKIYNRIVSANVKFQVGFNRRFDHSFSQVQKAVRKGEVGDLHLIKITSRDPAPPPASYIETSGGMFIDMSIHDFDLARYLSGSEVEEVTVTGANLIDPVFKKYGDIDTAVITLRFANGAIGVIDNSRKAAYGYDQRIEVLGSEGMVMADNVLNSTVRKSLSTQTQLDNPKYFFLERYKEAYIVELKAFFNAIIDDTDTLCSVKDGLEAERIAHAAKKALQTGEKVLMKDLTVIQ